MTTRKELDGMELSELIDEYEDQNEGYHLEGSSGLKHLCKLARVLGYKDFQNYGQFAPDGAYGDLLEFFQDNPGAMEAVVMWIKEQNLTEWCDNVRDSLEAEEDDEVDEDDE